MFLVYDVSMQPFHQNSSDNLQDSPPSNTSAQEGGVVADYGKSVSDDLYIDAVRCAIESRKASTSLLQRRLKIGYGRAARLIEQMEAEGIVGPADGARPREVLVSSIDATTKLSARLTNLKETAQKLAPALPPPKTDLELVEEFYAQLEGDVTFQEFITRYDTWVKTFFDIAERKVSVVDEYGDENWDALYTEIATLLAKIYKNERENGRPANWFDADGYLSVNNPKLRFWKLSAGTNSQLANLGLYLEVRFKHHHAEHTSKLNRRLLRDNFENMTGRQFEGFVATLLKGLGFNEIAGTPVTGDQGADLVAKKNGKTLLVQAKRYDQAVGNHAVQEIVGALKFYNGDYGWVVTNSTFTSSAVSLAQKNGIRLIDGQALTSLVSRLKDKEGF